MQLVSGEETRRFLALGFELWVDDDGAVYLLTWRRASKELNFGIIWGGKMGSGWSYR